MKQINENEILSKTSYKCNINTDIIVLLNLEEAVYSNTADRHYANFVKILNKYDTEI